ncbi:hypothetical protein L1049_014680 [Liquidambar formosana]|uniref:MULE transposase domain-containing protein n=1 Tax=Liquidambar formosana TaxID=63359 RepID=A0AAP0RWA4_LIQFO
MGKDPNEKMFPISITVVEAETRESWEWFLEILFSDIGSPNSRKWTFISDQHKALVPVLATIAPTVEYKFCVRHLYGSSKIPFFPLFELKPRSRKWMLGVDKTPL